MCFSAEASFAGGAIITAIGVMTIKKNRESSHGLFATIPLVFGLQQISEGFVWIALQSGDHAVMLRLFTYLFLLAAVVVWPVMIPLSLLLMERVKRRRNVIGIFLVAGIVTALYYGIGLILFRVSPQVNMHHIEYTNEFPRVLANPAFILYLISTLLPLYFSSVRKMWIFGILVTLSCLITGIFFREYLTSVWCFFAALISVVIFWIVTRERQLPSE